MTLQNIEGPEGALACDVTPSETWRAPVIFVHSDAGRRSHWRHAVAHLGQSRGSVTFDRRGHGDSAFPASGEFGYAEECKDIDAIADTLGFEKFVLVGHSGGGALSYEYAATRHAHVAGLLLVDPNGDPDVMPEEQWQLQLSAMRGEHFADAADAYYRSIAGSDAAVIAEVLRDLHATDQRTIVGLLEAAHAFRPADFAEKYSGPRLSLVQSAFDTASAIHRQGDGFPHTTIDGAGHWIHLAAPDRFHSMLDEFLADVDRA